ncbi:MAG: transposase [Dehalococcoidia bacterium]
MDEAGFGLAPDLVRTVAPIGTWDHPDQGPDTVRFLKHLLHQAARKVGVIWDNASIHRGQPAPEFLRTPLGQRLRLVARPSSAPELQAAGALWHHLKNGERRATVFAGRRHWWTGQNNFVQPIRVCDEYR